MKALLVYNNFAGGKTARKKKLQVINVLRKQGLQIELFETKPFKENIKEIKNIDLTPYDAFIIGGGDGSIMSALNGYIENTSLNKPPIGFIPVGTGNALVRDFGLKTGKIEAAAKIIAKNKPQALDAAKAIAGAEKFYFFNIMGIGFVSDVGFTAEKFKFLGNFAYTIGVVIQALKLKSEKIKLELDGQLHEFDSIFLEISNSRYTSNFLMAPDAKHDDGFLDVTVLTKLSLFKLLLSFPKILDGTHINMQEVHVFKAQKIKVTSQTSKIATPDGDLLGTTPLEVECIKHKLLFFGN